MNKEASVVKGCSAQSACQYVVTGVALGYARLMVENRFDVGNVPPELAALQIMESVEVKA